MSLGKNKDSPECISHCVRANSFELTNGKCNRIYFPARFTKKKKDGEKLDESNLNSILIVRRFLFKLETFDMFDRICCVRQEVSDCGLISTIRQERLTPPTEYWLQTESRDLWESRNQSRFVTRPVLPKTSRKC